jgi:small-conductance mechanosensitive channel
MMQRLVYARWLRRFFMGVWVLLIWAARLQAQDTLTSPESPIPPPWIAVRVGTRTAFELPAGSEELSLEERAGIVQRRIGQAQTGGAVRVEARPILPDSVRWEIRAGDRLIVVVGPQDAEASGQSAAAIATAWQEGLRAALAAHQTPRTTREVIRKVVIGLLFPVMLWVAFLLLGRFVRWMDRQADALEQQSAGGIHIGEFEVMRSTLLVSTISTLSRIIKAVLYVAVCYAAVILFFSLFPQTRPLGDWMIDTILDPAKAFGLGLLAFIPALIAALVATVIGRFLLRFIDFVIDRMNQDLVPMPALSHRLLFALRHLVRPVVVTVAALFVLSYVPGVSPKIIEYATIGLIALVIIGLWHPFENVMADVILSYIRPFRTGDRIRFGAFTGKVSHQSPFFIRIRDDTGHEQVIPNRMFMLSDFSIAPSSSGTPSASAVSDRSPQEPEAPPGTS